jgi:ribosome-binding protein aMBF1 (putative translation factor)
MSDMKNKHKGSGVRKWIDQELRTPGFRAGLRKARARRHVAQQIYDARKRAGMSQPELARRLHTSQAAISRMEAGDQNMTIDIIENIARALGGRFEGRIVLKRKA